MATGSARRSMRLVDYFQRAVERDGNQIAFQDELVSVTYREADESSFKVAAGLQAADLVDQHKVAVLCPNSAEAFVVVLGIIRSGAVWVPLNVRNTAQVNAAFLKGADCVCLFYHSSLSADVQEILEFNPQLEAVCIDDKPLRDHRTLEAFTADTATEVRGAPDDPDALLMILPTGGTTGRSKAVMITNQVWESVVATCLSCLKPHERTAWLVAGPMTHGAGIVGLMMMPAAPTYVILRKPDAKGVIDTLENSRITHLFIPPTLLNMVMEHENVSTRDFSSLEKMVISASPIAPDKLRKAVAIFGDAVCESYGQAEAMMFLTFLSNHDLRTIAPGQALDRFASCGRATLGARVEIMDDEGNVLPPLQKGEIVAQGSFVFPGYYKNDEATAEVSTHGWHHTGDVGYKDEQSFFYVLDRKKDMIVTGGFNVFSAEVEAAIISHTSVRECVVIGVPDERWGEAVKAVVELIDGGQLDEAAVQALVRKRLGGVHTPKSVEFWPVLPRSPNGKILKSDVRAHFWRGRDRYVG